jgi:hypothetical protein
MSRLPTICQESAHPVFSSLDFTTIFFSFFTEQSRQPCLQPRAPVMFPQRQGEPVIPPGTGFPFRRLLRLAGLRWRYSNPPPRGKFLVDKYQYFGRICYFHLQEYSGRRFLRMASDATRREPRYRIWNWGTLWRACPDHGCLDILTSSKFSSL